MRTKESSRLGNVKPGQAAAKIYDTSDSIFDLSITPSELAVLEDYVGIARDLSAKLGRELVPQTDYQGNEKKLKTLTVNV